MALQLDNAENQLLVELLEGELQNVRSENYHAESHRVKEMMKEREGVIRGLIEKLRQSGESSSA